MAHLEYLKVILKGFNPITTFNRAVLIWYFRDSFCSSIRAQLDERKKNLDMWDKVIKKAINTNANASQQPRLGIWAINNWCSQGLRPIKIEEKSVDKKLTKSSNSLFANLENHSKHFFSCQRQSQGQALALLSLQKYFCY